MRKKMLFVLLPLILCVTVFSACNHPNKENNDNEEYRGNSFSYSIITQNGKSGIAIMLYHSPLKG